MALLYASGAVAIGLVVSWLVTPLTSRLAHRFGILDDPGSGQHKSHKVATPYLGGVAILTGCLIGASTLLLLAREQLGPSVPRLLIGLLLATALSLIGLLDDVRTLPRVVRVAAQLGAAGAAWHQGFRVQATPSTSLNILITILWIVGITNAFNLLDNLDGLTAGLAGVGALGFTFLAVSANLDALAPIAGAAAGASFGFLAHNRHPAKIFMGDAGSLFLGFLLALIGIKLKFENLVQVTFLVPVVVLGLPIFDTTLVVISRLRRGKSPFLGGRDHVSHRLLSVGLPVKTTVLLLYWCGLCLAWLGLVISRSNVEVGWMLLGFVSALGIFFGAMLWKVPLEVDTPQRQPIDRSEEAIDPDELARVVEA